MINIKITYAGRNYNSFGDAIKDAAMDGIKESITKTLQPFESEIRKSGGQIMIDIPESMKNMKVEVKRIPEDLKERIMNALK